VAMATTLVYTGEHFVFDILLGWTYAVVTFVVGSRLLDRRDARKAAKAAKRGPAVDLQADAGDRHRSVGASATTATAEP